LATLHFNNKNTVQSIKQYEVSFSTLLLSVSTSIPVLFVKNNPTIVELFLAGFIEPLFCPSKWVIGVWKARRVHTNPRFGLTFLIKIHSNTAFTHHVVPAPVRTSQKILAGPDSLLSHFPN
jgi:hypothetical protein